MMKNYYLFLILFLSCLSLAFGQTTIYNEDFTGQAARGAYGPASAIYLKGVNWNVDIAGANLSTNDRYIQVTENYIEGRNLRNTASWISPVIDISGFTNVEFTLDAFVNNEANFEPSDRFITEYRINGGAWTIAANNGNLSGGFPLTVVSDDGLVGNTIEISVTMRNGATDEQYRLDNILIQGIAPVTPTIIVNPNSASRYGYVEGESSFIEGNFTVQGFNLGADIILSAPANFEISTISNGSFANNLTLPQTSGTVGLTKIYLRLISSLNANIYNGNLTATSNELTDNVVLEGEVTPRVIDCSSLIISEYHEDGNGTNTEERYIELFNLSASTIDLSNYRLASYRNGFGLVRSVNLVGSVAPYTTFLISRLTSSRAADADFATDNNVMVFTGDDAIALQTINGENIDVVGVIGDDSNFGKDTVLRRNINVAIPTTNYDASQWMSTPANDPTNLGAHISSCECPDTTTWDGNMWDNGLPTISTVAIIDGNYDTGSSADGNFGACSIIVNSSATLTISDGSSIEIENDIVANGNINVTSEGSVIQLNNLGTVSGSGIIEVTKTTAPMNNWYEYTYWSSPTENTTIDNGLTDGTPSRRFRFEAQNYLDAFAEMNNDNTQNPGQDDIDDNGDAWTPVNGSDIMIPGVGYASTHREDIFFIPMGQTFNRFDYSFIGFFNNGIIEVPIYRNDSEMEDTNWNFIGNPYPSAIDVNAFFSENVNAINSSGLLDGDIYLWSQNSQPSNTENGNEGFNFVQSDYAVINGTGETQGGDDTNGDGVVDINDRPKRFIPSGQGFFVSFSDDATPTTGNVIFNNAMRVTGNNTQFFRNSGAADSDTNKIWLNLTTDNGIFNQILIGYLDGATDNFDGSYFDSTRNLSGGYNSIIYSRIENDESGYVIQGKNTEALNLNEIIPVGFNTIIDQPTIYTISIPLIEGEFLNSNPIFIKDNLLNSIHNLKESDYNFTSEVGIFENRFEIIFNANVLATNDNQITTNKLSILELANGNVEIKINTSLTIDNVEILDITGRKIYNLKGNASTEIYNLSQLSRSAYIARVTLSNGQVISKKAIKQY